MGEYKIWYKLAMCSCSPEKLFYPRKTVANRLGEVILPLCSALLSPQWSVVSSAGILSIRVMGTFQIRSKKSVKTCVKKRRRELGLFMLEKRRLNRHLIAAFQYVKGDFKEDGERPGAVRTRQGATF